MMTNYVKNYKKTAITKAYDLLELKANGRIDDDGDYLDDEGQKLTIHTYDLDNKTKSPAILSLSTPNPKSGGSKITSLCDETGFIILDQNGERWGYSRNEFLATYEEVK